MSNLRYSWSLLSIILFYSVADTTTIDCSATCTATVVVDSSEPNDNITVDGNIDLTGANVGRGLELDSVDNKVIIVSGYIKPTGDVNQAVFLTNANYNHITVNSQLLGSSSNASDSLELDNSNYNNIIVNAPGFDYASSTATSLSDNIEMRDSSNNNITINGNIIATGDNAAGIVLFNGNTNNTITINGSITANDYNAIDIGVFYGGTDNNNNTIHLYGDITPGTGANDYAIAIDNANSKNRIILHRGARIQGDISSTNSSNILEIDCGSSASYFYDIDTSGITLYDANKPVVSGSIASMGVASINNEGHRIFDMFAPLKHSVNSRQRLQHLDMLDSGMWGGGYYKTAENEEPTQVFSRTTKGGIAGYSTYSNNNIVDLVLNIEQDEAGFGLNHKDEILKSTTVIAGVHMPRLAKLKNVSIRALVGHSFHEIDRKVLLKNGSENVLGDYGSTYALVGSDVLLQHESDYLTTDFQASVDAVLASILGYRSTEYFQTKYRNYSQVHASAQVGLSYQSYLDHLTARTYVDVSYRNALNSDQIEYMILNHNVSHKVEESDQFYYTIGADLDVLMDDYHYSLGVLYRTTKLTDNDETEVTGFTTHFGIVKH